MKWINRFLGWIIVVCVGAGMVSAYAYHRHIGYGTVEIRMSWRGQPLAPGVLAERPFALLLQGSQVGWMPDRAIKVRPGMVGLELRVKHFQPARMQVQVQKDGSTKAEFRLEAELCTISLVQLRPNSVVNGERCGESWVLKDAEVGRRYPVTVVAPGFETNHLTLQIDSPGQNLVTNVVWRSLIGYVTARFDSSIRDCRVTLDGKQLDTLTGWALPVGPHNLTASNENYFSWSERVEIEEGRTNYCDIRLKPKPASLSLVVDPEVDWQLVEAEGHRVDLSNGVAFLQAGNSRLTVSAPGYTSQMKEFTVEPNRSYSWRVQLEKEGLKGYQQARSQFEELTNANWAILQSAGGNEWGRIQKRRFNDRDLVEGASDFKRASDEVIKLLTDAEELAKYKKEYGSLTSSRQNREALQRFGGSAWQHIQAFEPANADVSTCAREYKEAYWSLAEVLASLPERGRVWTNEVRAANAVSYWITIDQLVKARNELDGYTKQFGPSSDFDRWYGGSKGKIQGWQDQIEHQARFGSLPPATVQLKPKR